jgi:hypothetical protein
MSSLAERTVHVGQGKSGEVPDATRVFAHDVCGELVKPPTKQTSCAVVTEVSTGRRH